LRVFTHAVQNWTGETVCGGVEFISNIDPDDDTTSVAGSNATPVSTKMTDWTTLLERAWTRRPQYARVPQRAPRIFPIEQSTSQVPREYRALHTYLEHRYASVVVLTFDQIEALLGCALPTPARTEREWWTDIVETQRHCAAWTKAGRTAAPNLPAGIIAFERSR